MPNTLESREYERFDYKHFEDKELTLEDAIREVQRKRASGTGSVIYRVVPIGHNMGSFRVDEVPLEKASEEFRLRLADMWSRMLLKYRRFSVR